MRTSVMILMTIAAAILLSGCGYKQVTIYDDCLSEEVVFSLKESKAVYGYDYGFFAPGRYSSLEQPDGEYIVCLGERCPKMMPCKKKCRTNYLGNTHYHEIRLTGRYAHIEPQFADKLGAPKTHLFQAEIDGHTIWFPSNSIRRMDVLDEYKSAIDHLYSKSEIDDIGHIKKFTCPNPDAKRQWWEHIDSLD